MIQSNWHLPPILIFIISLLFANICFADNLEDEVGGLVIDRTITRFGKEFSQNFSTLWWGIKGSNKYTIVIIEKPIPQSGTVVTIEFKGQKIFQTFFGRRKTTNDENIAEQAIAIVVNHLANLLEQDQNPDLLGEGY